MVFIPIIPVLGRYQNCKFKASLGYIVRPCPTTTKKIEVMMALSKGEEE
jgi:hypothetical protein